MRRCRLRGPGPRALRTATAPASSDPVHPGVARDREPRPASERVEPAFSLWPLGVLGEEDPREIGVGVARDVRAILAPERELGVRTRTAVRAGDLQRHERRLFRSFRTARDAT